MVISKIFDNSAMPKGSPQVKRTAGLTESEAIKKYILPKAKKYL